MAAGPIFNAIADLRRINQKGSLERVASLSGTTIAAVVTSLKANKALLNLNSENIRFNNTYVDEAEYETDMTALAVQWNGS